MAVGPVAVAFDVIQECYGLLDEEVALMAGAGSRRRNEFSAGRRAARRALASLGCGPQSLLIGRLREPLWPAGFAGSISHDGRFAGAVAYPSTSGLARLSIDLVDRADHEAYVEVGRSFLHPEDALPPGDSLAAARLFSAKEAAVKIVSPHQGDLVDPQRLCAIAQDQDYEIVATDSGEHVLVRQMVIDGVIVSLGLLLS